MLPLLLLFLGLGLAGESSPSPRTDFFPQQPNPGRFPNGGRAIPQVPGEPTAPTGFLPGDIETPIIPGPFVPIPYAEPSYIPPRAKEEGRVIDFEQALRQQELVDGLEPTQFFRFDAETVSDEISHSLKRQREQKRQFTIDKMNLARQPRSSSMRDLTPDVLVALRWLGTAVALIQASGFPTTPAFHWFVRLRARENMVAEDQALRLLSSFLLSARSTYRGVLVVGGRMLAGDILGSSWELITRFVQWISGLNREAEYKKAIEDFYPHLLKIFEYLGPPPTALVHYIGHIQAAGSKDTNPFYIQPEKVNSAGDLVLLLMQTHQVATDVHLFPVNQVCKPGYGGLTGLWNRHRIIAFKDLVSFVLDGRWYELKTRQGAGIYIEYALTPEGLLGNADKKGRGTGQTLLSAYRKHVRMKYGSNPLAWFRFDYQDLVTVLQTAGYGESSLLRFTVGYDPSPEAGNLSKRYWEEKFHAFVTRKSWLLSRPDPQR